MQRVFDIFFSALSLLLLSPLLIPVAIFLKNTGEGEIFYCQNRVGKHGKLFRLYKFSTMLKNSPNMKAGTVTIKDDPRILPSGKFFRKTKINELPQLLNIFLGDMSVIGPRPLTEQTFNSYSLEVQKAVEKVKPGLSGIGSIVFRNEEDILCCDVSPIDFYKNVIAPYKGALEQWYVQNQSVKIYFTAIFVTAWLIISPKSTVVWRAFPQLPAPPRSLAGSLNYQF
ncbi:lipid carrier--UDP-N-acetylgalactosaminyltransferase [Polynucleobacter tropicus]|uniref:Lipid carrier--UDP-N-acetylgalactosaminyltransferase n=1 Tax=Polynucleobacter tropicus TaxID=1743174 RepID=A0A6M9Q1X4_9BURK|nr:sugar transferase [Polynucleobacter tropicus]QKM64066.1 lipid carrier--UDP-N-acetylgalactosaminyltransferase [Polynucleobacter tropicus]